MIRGILLAAGASRRYGGCKLLDAHWQGRPIAALALEHLAQVLPQPLAVVSDPDSVLAETLRSRGAQIVVNAEPERGMSASIAVAVQASAEASGWIIALADMPWVQASSIAAVVAALCDGAPAAAPSFQGRRGHPVGFASHLRPQLLQLSGAAGARDLFRRTEGRRVAAVDDPGVLLDVDRPGDLASGPPQG